MNERTKLVKDRPVSCSCLYSAPTTDQAYSRCLAHPSCTAWEWIEEGSWAGRTSPIWICPCPQGPTADFCCCWVCTGGQEAPKTCPELLAMCSPCWAGLELAHGAMPRPGAVWLRSCAPEEPRFLTSAVFFQNWLCRLQARSGRMLRSEPAPPITYPVFP